MVVLLIVVGVVALFAVGMYNALIGKKNTIKNMFGAVDTLLKKRYDLIPNLVGAVQSYMKHEREILTEVTRLRAEALAGNLSDDQKMDLDQKISKAIGDIMVAVENYPNLKANEQFMHLQRTLAEVEEQISAARRAYNAAVTDYNNAVEMFPTKIMAQLMNYRTKRVFTIGSTERQSVDVHGLFQR
ncbi:MAG: LemA family protein [bacterium]|jgi:LemA protein